MYVSRCCAHRDRNKILPLSSPMCRRNRKRHPLATETCWNRDSCGRLSWNNHGKWTCTEKCHTTGIDTRPHVESTRGHTWHDYHSPELKMHRGKIKLFIIIPIESNHNESTNRRSTHLSMRIRSAFGRRQSAICTNRLFSHRRFSHLDPEWHRANCPNAKTAVRPCIRHLWTRRRFVCPCS